MKQGEIWIINLDPTVGSEIKKTRPAIIINDDALGKLPLRIIVPLTDWKERFELAPWMVKIEPTGLNGLIKTSSADCFQIRSVSQRRFHKKVGRISIRRMDQIRSGLKKILSMQN
ncbi:MAG: type II toxin-antitoxin system PemK/MazF family toxin [Bacteroidales bacterium]|nr:type II toxin-antitoxin system PemK/MazF family toxin [Bacteroidales bacterium]